MHATRRQVNFTFGTSQNKLQGVTFYGLHPEPQSDLLSEVVSPRAMKFFSKSTPNIVENSPLAKELVEPLAIGIKRKELNVSGIAKETGERMRLKDRVQAISIFRNRKRKDQGERACVPSQKKAIDQNSRDESLKFFGSSNGYVTYFHFDKNGQESGYSFEEIKERREQSTLYRSRRSRHLSCSVHDLWHESPHFIDGNFTGSHHLADDEFCEEQNVNGVSKKTKDCFCAKHKYLNSRFSLEDFSAILVCKGNDVKLKTRLQKQLKFFFDSAQHKLLRRSNDKYKKFVPVPKSRGKFVKKHWDAISHTCGHVGSWMDIQNACMKKRKRRSKDIFYPTSLIPKSPSDTTLTDYNRSRIQIGCIEKSHSDTALENIHVNTLFTNSSLARFDYDHNDRYCKVASSLTPNFEVALYAMTHEADDDLLRHVKTDLLACALKEFFHPYEKVQVQWTDSIDSLIETLLDNRAELIPHIGGSSNTLRQGAYKAVLCLSADAGVMLRHKDLQFLDSVTSTLEMKRRNLLILKM